MFALFPETYFNLAHRASSYLNDELAPNSPFKPLLPNVFQTEGSKLSTGVGQYSLGGMADSYYEWVWSFMLRFLTCIADLDVSCSGTSSNSQTYQCLDR